MLDVILAVEATYKRDRLVPGAEGPLARIGREAACKQMVAAERKRPGVPGLGLLRILFGMTLAANGGAGVLAGCYLQKQRGQYETTCYQISLPLN